MTPEQARQIIAYHLIDCLLSEHDVQWEDWPDVGEDDWLYIDQIIRTRGLAWRMTKQELDEAHKVLRERADHGGM